MKRLSQSKSYTTSGPLTLYLDDIERIWNVMKANCASVQLVANDCEFVDVADLAAFKERIKEFSLHCSKPYLSLTKTTFELRLYCADGDATSVGVFHEIEAVIKKRIRVISFKNGWLLFAAIIAQNAWMLWLNNFVANTTLNVVVTVLVSVLYLLWVGYWGYNKLTGRAIQIRQIHSSDTPTFAERYGEKILIALIGAVFGATLTYIARLLPTP